MLLGHCYGSIDKSHVYTSATAVCIVDVAVGNDVTSMRRYHHHHHHHHRLIIIVVTVSPYGIHRNVFQRN